MGELQPIATFANPIDFSEIGIELPVIVVDDDFIEFLEEESVESMEVVEMAEYWAQWEKENLSQ